MYSTQNGTRMCSVVQCNNARATSLQSENASVLRQNT